jgi:hypothetical protein
MRRSALRSLFPTMEDGRQDLLETLGLQKTLLDMLGHDAVELFHRNGVALAAGLTLPCFG